MLTYNGVAFKPFITHVGGTLKVTAWAACIEETLNPTKPKTRQNKKGRNLTAKLSVYHCHAYFSWFHGDGVEMRNTDIFMFQGVKPRVDACTVRHPGGWKVAAQHGLWYVYAKKLGTYESASNMKPWRDYCVRREWVVSLWEQHKLSHEQYKHHSHMLRTGHAARMTDLAAVVSTERAHSVKTHVAAELELLHAAAPLQKFRPFTEVDSFMNYFAAAPRWRRPMLAIVAPTNFGKSLLGADVLMRLAELLVLPGYLEVTVQGDGLVDLSAYDLNMHAGILLDGVGDALFLHHNRETLQGRPKVEKGAKSATMMYSYDYTLARRGIVVTFDLSATNLHLFQTHHWLSRPENVIVLRLASTAWVRSTISLAASQEQTVQERVALWTVDEVARWLSSQDATGLADTFRINAVNGRDLLAFKDVWALTEGLRLTPFAARKLLSIRDGLVSDTV